MAVLCALQPIPIRSAQLPLDSSRESLELLAIHIHHDARQVLQRLPQLGRMFGDVGNLFDLQQRPNAQAPAGKALDPGDARQVHAARELIQRGRWQVVGFIQHQEAVVQLGQHARAQRRQQQIVVGHDHLRAHQLLAFVVVSALAERRAVLARARCALGRHGAPHLGLGRRVQAVAVAVPGTFGQRLRHRGIELDARLGLMPGALGAGGGFFLGKQVVFALFFRLAMACEAVELELAHIAPAPFGQRKFEGLRHQRGQCGQVFVDQLLLQCHRGGRDQHPRAPRQRQRNGGCAIRQRLAHARARLDDGDGARGRGLAAFFVHLAQRGAAERARHLLGHQPLPGAAAKPFGGADHRIKRLQGRLGPFCRRHNHLL